MAEPGRDQPSDRVLEVGVEDIEPDHWVAWILAMPGCYARGGTEAEAVAGAPDAWRAETGGDAPGPGPLRVVERWRGMPAADAPGFIVNATFGDDWRPLDAAEIGAGIARLERDHRRFLDVIGGMPVSDEIGGIIRHLATAEQWYLANIDLQPDGQPPDDPLERFAWIRAFTLRVLPALAGRDMRGECGGEGWTPRKVLRRTIWHERDHTQQIATILAALT